MNNHFNNIELSLSLKNYYDLKISEAALTSIECSTSLKNRLIASFEFDGSNKLISAVRWEGYELGEGICDASHENNEGYFALKQITGDTFCHEITENNFLGGFYQGYFKAEGYGYQTLPDSYLNGAAFEFWLKPATGDTEACADKLLLNAFNENNSGFFFYYGIKEESPYCGRVVSGQTCEGIPLQPEYEDNTIYPWASGNTFLYYTEQNVCNPPPCEQIFTYPDCCGEITCNALGVRLTGGGAFNVRYIGTSGECVNNVFVSEKVLFDYYSSTGQTSNTEWNHIVLKFSHVISTQECDKHRQPQKMLLSIWVDGKNIYEILVPELRPYGMSMHRSLQLGIPYNISVGGGTMGNLENALLNSGSETIMGCSYSLCYNQTEDVLLLGYYIGKTFFETNLALDENLEDNLSQIFDGQIVVERTVLSNNCVRYNIAIHTSENLTSVKIGEHIINAKKDYCYSITASPACSHLAEQFAGSFIGQIDKFNIYDKALKVQEIRCLYENMKGNYGKGKTLCCF